MSGHKYNSCVDHTSQGDNKQSSYELEGVSVELEYHRFGEEDGPDQLTFGSVVASSSHYCQDLRRSSSSKRLIFYLFVHFWFN